MISDFLSSWNLFHNTYEAGVLIAVLLSLVGVLVVARDQIFIGAAISQASIVGLTVGMWAERWLGFSETSWYEFDPFVAAFGGLFAVAGALLTARAGGNTISREAVTGWVFLFGMSFSVLIVAHSPHGLEEVHRLATSTLIGAREADVAIFAIAVLVAAAALWRWHREIVLVVMDPEMAKAVGLKTEWWDRLLYVSLGFGVAFALRVSGMVYTFGYLVLPALVARGFCREMRTIFLVAPVVATVTSLTAFIVANAYDLPPAHVAVAVLAVASALSSVWQKFRT